MNRFKILPLLLMLLLAFATVAAGQQNPRNPCGGKKEMVTADNPCGEKSAMAGNPCGGKSAMAGNPCGGKSAMAGNPCGGKRDASHDMDAMNPCHAKLGKVFHVTDPMGRNTVTFSSEAPLEDIIGTTNKIHGYVVFDPDMPQKGGRGHLMVPVSSLTTGIPLRDEHLRGPAWLDAGAYPEIEFVIDDIRQVEVVKKTADYTTYKMVLVGPFTLHGHTQRRFIAARITYMPESDRTRQKAPGDLLAGRVRFEVNLEEFGIKGMGDVVGSKVSETIEVEISIVANSKTEELAGNPCNPCGGKVETPGNPCGEKPHGT